MSQRILRCFLVTSLICLLAAIPGVAATSGTIQGLVRDSQTGEPLPGSNIMLVKTSLGASTDVDGKYTIRDVPAGSYTVRATYVGYKQKETTIQLNEGQTLKLDFKLVAVGVEGEEVVVTAQAAGQKEAINQQLSSMPIVNIVSRARIQELPDANAAESVSRLPGVSLIRTGGEGSKVVIRGLSPQYNQVTIDGVELPSNVTSGNNITGSGTLETTGNAIGDRGEDLSMISSSMLGGIEVTKAITPDMDATLIGGVVNFALRKAQRTQLAAEDPNAPQAPMVELRMQGGYNNLKSSYDNYRAVASVEKRFFDQSFGVFVQGSDERRNLSANTLGASYALSDKTHGDAPFPRLTGVNLDDVFRKRQRQGGTIVMDFQHERGEIDLMNFVSVQTTQEITRGENLNADPPNNYIDYTANEANNKLNVLSNLLSVKHDFSFFRADLKISHSYTESNNPEDLSFDFFQDRAGFDNLGDATKIDPKTLASLAKPNQANAGLLNISTSAATSKERNIQGSLDLMKDVSLSTDVSTRIKIGGMFQHRTRNFDYNTASGNQGYSGGGGVITAMLTQYPWLTLSGGRLGLSNFTNDSYKYGEFLNGDYSLAYPINVNLMWALLPIAKRTPTLEGYQVNKLGSQINDYNGYENKSAAYAMFSLDLGPTISLIPGVRYQNLTTNYTAMRGTITAGGKIQGGDTTVTHSHGYYLPMVHLRYIPIEWMQVHFAYTNTLNYPDYGTLTPRYLVAPGTIDYNNHAIKPATSENFDLVVAVHSNEIGLLSVDGFKKKIKDLVFFAHTWTSNLSNYPDLPQGGTQLYALNTYINNPNPVDLWGIETEWQTHFWYLPKPFDGLVMNVNYTHIFSEAKYPKSIKNVVYDEEGNAVITVLDTTYTTRMLNQPNDIVNLALGYDLGGFSLRVSLLFQDNVFKQPDFWFQQRVNSAKFTRWDLSVKQELPWYGMQLFFTINNITGEDDIDVNQKNLFPASEQRYGMSADAGIVIHL